VAAGPFSGILAGQAGGLLAAETEEQGIAFDGGLLAAAVVGSGFDGGLLKEYDGILSPNAELEDPATEVRRLARVLAAGGLLVCLMSEVRFGSCTTPRLGLALAPRTTGTGFAPRLRDLERSTFAPPSSDGGNSEAGFVVVRRGAALAVLATDDAESQLDVDVLSDDFIRDEMLLFLTMNLLP